MLISTILSAKGSQVATIDPQATVAELVERLTTLGIGALVVSHDGSQPVGIVSERDVVHRLARDRAATEATVAEIMTSLLYTASPDSHVDEIMMLMTEHRVRHVPITDHDGALMGIVSIGDVVKSRLGELETERTALLDYINQ